MEDAVPRQESEQSCIYIYAKGIDCCICFNDFSIGFWNYSDSGTFVFVLSQYIFVQKATTYLKFDVCSIYLFLLVVH